MSCMLGDTTQNTADKVLALLCSNGRNMINWSMENESRLMISAGKEVEEGSKRIAGRNH